MYEPVFVSREPVYVRACACVCMLSAHLYLYYTYVVRRVLFFVNVVAVQGSHGMAWHTKIFHGTAWHRVEYPSIHNLSIVTSTEWNTTIIIFIGLAISNKNQLNSTQPRKLF